MTQDPSYEETCQFALTAESIVINKEINGEKQLTLAAVSVDKDLTKELAHKETQIELLKQQITLLKEQNKNSTNSQEIKTQETTVARSLTVTIQNFQVTTDLVDVTAKYGSVTIIREVAKTVFLDHKVKVPGIPIKIPETQVRKDTPKTETHLTTHSSITSHVDTTSHPNQTSFSHSQQHNL